MRRVGGRREGGRYRSTDLRRPSVLPPFIAWKYRWCLRACSFMGFIQAQLYPYCLNLFPWPSYFAFTLQVCHVAAGALGSVIEKCTEKRSREALREGA